MTVAPLRNLKVLEVAQYTFTPSAGAILADWGAEVIKVEHAESGDAQRGMTGAVGAGVGSFRPVMEHANRGKRSIGLALENQAAHDILMELATISDVFLTNFLPEARRRLRIDVEHVRAANPDIIYARGSAHGPRGPEANRGGYDGSTFWSRAGCAVGVTPLDAPRLMSMPAGAYGDSMSGMSLAGGIAAALLERERFGTPSIVDVSLLSVGMWAMALPVEIALLTGQVIEAPRLDAPLANPLNPTIGNFRTSDGRWINLTVLQAGRYWADVCRHLDLEELVDDDRFADAARLSANACEAGRLVAEAIARHPYEYWIARLQTMEGQWAPNPTSLEAGNDVQVRANGYVVKVCDAEGVDRELIANPVQFDVAEPALSRAPQFAEHTDEILRELGRDEDGILELKVQGAVT